MAITREELKVGETYVCGNAERTVLGIGNSKVFYGLNEPGLDYLEYTWDLNRFIECHSLKPKPKKTIELVGFASNEGYFREIIKYSSGEIEFAKDSYWKQVSTRIIEINE